jgi:hypothetical protein
MRVDCPAQPSPAQPSPAQPSPAQPSPAQHSTEQRQATETHARILPRVSPCSYSTSVILTATRVESAMTTMAHAARFKRCADVRVADAGWFVEVSGS